MGGDGSNIRLIYIEDEQPLVFPQIAKKCPMRECAPLSPTFYCEPGANGETPSLFIVYCLFQVIANRASLH